MQTEAVIEQLAGIVGVNQVLGTPDLMAAFVVDWTGRYRGDAICVVRTNSVDEVSAVLALFGCGYSGCSPRWEHRTGWRISTGR